MNGVGILLGGAAFLLIGAFHPIVIKAEYYFGKGVWPAFLAAGLCLAAVSLFVKNTVGSAILGVLACACLWSIRELFEQEERVRKGWFPKNEKRNKP